MRRVGNLSRDIALIIAVPVFFLMIYMLGQQKSFDLWRFSLLFTLIIALVYWYTYIDMRRQLKK